MNRQTRVRGCVLRLGLNPEPTSRAMDIRIQPDDLTHPAVHALLEEHLSNMRAISPPGSVHALDLDRLRDRSISFWSAWRGPDLVGIGALKALSPEQGEIKSMRTPSAKRGLGVGRLMLQHIIEQASARGYVELLLETGSMADFLPAQSLYARYGFVRCGPFGAYTDDPHSVFMRKTLRDSQPSDDQTT